MTVGTSNKSKGCNVSDRREKRVDNGNASGAFVSHTWLQNQRVRRPCGVDMFRAQSMKRHKRSTVPCRLNRPDDLVSATFEPRGCPTPNVFPMFPLYLVHPDAESQYTRCQEDSFSAPNAHDVPSLGSCPCFTCLWRTIPFIATSNGMNSELCEQFILRNDVYS